jgi:hypothetical protein
MASPQPQDRRIAGNVPVTLSIVLPALDEEAAIGDTIARCLAARAAIVAAGPVAAVEVVVVSDGSRDRTEAIACGFPEVTVLAFDHNRGYGAALKAGFAHARGEWLAFLDADGTCDPACLAALCRALADAGADLAIGSRLGPGTGMPWLRRLGNVGFAALLGLLSRTRVRDVASGVRVLRRSALPALGPLPDGLHYTPAMTARAVLEGRLALVEVPVPYGARLGESKLSLVRDGLRFAVSILRTAAIHRPARVLLLAAAALALAALALGLGPSAYWLRHGRLEETMIHRVLLALLCGTGVALLAPAAALAEQIAAIAHGRPPARTGLTGLLRRALSRRAALAAATALGAAAVAISLPGLLEVASGSAVTMHWSRAMLSSLLVVLAMALGTAVFLSETIDWIRAARAAPAALATPDRVRPGAGGAGSASAAPANGVRPPPA